MNKILLVLIFSFCSAIAKNLPQGFLTCQKADPKINECLKEAINKALNQLKDGAPELDVESIDAVKVNFVNIDQGGQSISLKQTFRNAEIRHLSNSVVKKVAIDFTKNQLKGETFTPKMEFYGDYKMDGKILFLPITGKGKANVTFVELKTRHDLQMEKVIKDDGNTYWVVKNYNVKFIPKLATFSFQNLFNGDKMLGRTMNDILNSNWELLLSEILPSYEEKFGQIFKGLANKIFEHVPANQIFIE